MTRWCIGVLEHVTHQHTFIYSWFRWHVCSILTALINNFFFFLFIYFFLFSPVFLNIIFQLRCITMKIIHFLPLAQSVRVLFQDIDPSMSNFLQTIPPFKKPVFLHSYNDQTGTLKKKKKNVFIASFFVYKLWSADLCFGASVIFHNRYMANFQPLGSIMLV